MNHKYESTFHYSITRPYPFRWFTPIVIVAGIILTALLSTLNFYANGFELQNHSTQDPLSLWKDTFFRLPPFLANRIQPQCSPVEIPIDSTVFTNQTALKYRLNGVKQCNGGNEPDVTQSSLRFYNNPFKNCSIEALTITIESSQQTPQQRAWNQWAPKLRASINCVIPNTPAPIFRTTNKFDHAEVDMTTEYTYVPEDVIVPPANGPSSEGLFSMTYEDSQKKASMWWGSSLLSMFWAQVTQKLTESTTNTRTPLTKGILYFTRNPSVTDISNLDFFNLDYRFFEDNTNGSSKTFTPNDTTNNFSPHSIANFDSHQTYPNIWVPADSLVKSFYSTILTDLGQVLSKSNILADPRTLTYFTSNFSNIVNEVSKAQSKAFPGPANQSFAEIGSKNGPLEVTPTTIAAQFLCQMPAQRDGFSIFLSVLVQDLVMLNAVWRLYTFIVTTFFLTRKRAGHEFNHCNGCAPNVSNIANIIHSPNAERSTHGGDSPPEYSTDGTYMRRRCNEKQLPNLPYQSVAIDDCKTDSTDDLSARS